MSITTELNRLAGQVADLTKLTESLNERLFPVLTVKGSLVKEENPSKPEILSPMEFQISSLQNQAFAVANKLEAILEGLDL